MPEHSIKPTEFFSVSEGAVVIGCRFNTLEFIETLLYQGRKIAGIVTLAEDRAQAAGVPSWVDLKKHFGQNFPVHVSRSYKLQQRRDLDALGTFSADVGFCIGWQRLLPDWFLEHFRNGVFGMHACQFMLPRGRGRSPVNWGMINGAEIVQAHIFRYSNLADGGDILSIRPLPVFPQDDIHSMQQKSRVIFNRVADSYWDDLITGNPKLFPPQNGEPDLEYPKRTPADGQIDWRNSVRQINDWVRAQTRPYPGAFTVLKNHQFKVWRSHPFGIPLEKPALPGEIVDQFEDGTYLVQAGDGLVHLVDHELPTELNTGERFLCP